jgi:hypothetical protein
VTYTSGKGNLPVAVINNLANVATTKAHTAGAVTAAAIKGAADIAASKAEAAGNIMGMAIHNVGYKANKLVNKVQNIHSHKKEIIGDAINTFGHMMQTGGKVVSDVGTHISLKGQKSHGKGSDSVVVTTDGGSGSISTTKTVTTSTEIPDHHSTSATGDMVVDGSHGSSIVTDDGTVGTIGSYGHGVASGTATVTQMDSTSLANTGSTLPSGSYVVNTDGNAGTSQVLGTSAGQGAVNMNTNSYYLNPSNANQVAATGVSSSTVQQQGAQIVAGGQGASLTGQGGGVGTVGTTAAVPGQQITGTAIAGQQITGTAMPGQQITGTAMPGQQITGTAMPGQQITGTAMPGQQITGTAMPGQQVTGGAVPGQQIIGTASGGIGSGGNLGTPTMTTTGNINTGGSSMTGSTMTTNNNIIVSGSNMPAGSMQGMPINTGSKVVSGPKSFVSNNIVTSGTFIGGDGEVAVKGPFKTVEGAAKVGKLWGRKRL